MFRVLNFSSGKPAGVPVSDPFAEVRMLKTWARLGVYTIIMAFGAVDYYIFGLSFVQMLYVRVASLTVATLAIELIFHQSLKLRKRSAYPARVLVEAGAADSVPHALDVVLASLRKLIGIRAGLILFDTSADGELLSATGWSETAGRRLSQELAAELQEYSESVEPVRIPATPGLVSGGVCGEDEIIVLVPMLAFNRSIGVIAMAGDRTNRDLADGDLLQGIGNAVGVALDSLQKRAEIEAKEERLRAVVTAAPVVLFRLDASGVFTLLEGKALERLNIQPDDVIGRSAFEALRNAPEVSDGIRRALGGETVKATTDLAGLSFEAELCPIADASGEIVSVIGVATDVTERKRAEDMIRHMAFHDSLTGLPNRELFERKLTESLSHARHEDQLLSVLFVDLDGFKEANDTVGHAEGDRVLKEVAESLAGLVREGDVVARIGGDEFLVLLPAIDTPREAVRVSERILNGLDVSWQVDGRQFHISASIGVAVFPQDGEDGATLLRSADHAMYEAKRRGKAQYAMVAAVAD